MCFCKNKKQETFNKWGSVFMLFPSAYWRIFMFTTISMKFVGVFFPFPESSGTKTSSQNYWCLPTDRQNFYTYAEMWYSHVLFKQFKSILFPRTSHRQKLSVHLPSACTECVYICIFIVLLINGPSCMFFSVTWIFT